MKGHLQYSFLLVLLIVVASYFCSGSNIKKNKRNNALFNFNFSTPHTEQPLPLRTDSVIDDDEDLMEGSGQGRSSGSGKYDDEEAIDSSTRGYESLQNEIEFKKLPLYAGLNRLLNSYSKLNLKNRIRGFDGETAMLHWEQHGNYGIDDMIRNYTELIRRQEQDDNICLNQGKVCRAKDVFGHEWTVCRSQGGYRECPGSNRWYIITWNCSMEGNFVTEQPNFHQCSSPELGSINNLLYYKNHYRRRTQISVEDANDVLEKLSNITSKENNGTYNYFGHEMPEILSLASQAVIMSDNVANYTQIEVIGEKALSSIYALLANREPWKELPKVERPNILTQVIETTESVGFNLIGRVGLKKGHNKTFYPLRSQYVDQKGILLSMGSHVKPDNKYGENKLFFSDQTFPQETSICVNLSRSVYNALHINEGDSVKYVGAIVKSDYLENIFNFTIKEEIRGGNANVSTNSYNIKSMNGKLLSFKLNDSSTTLKLEDFNVMITFKHNVPAIGDRKITFRRRLHPGEVGKAILGESTCVYWNTRELIWSTDGCRKTTDTSNSIVTTCECNHLTSFAVLTGFHNYAGRDRGLEILTWVLSLTSIFCLLMAVVTFNTVNPIRSDHVKITSNLCVALIFGNILLLIGDKDNYNLSDTSCIVIGALNHYAWLCVFGWMAVEGIHLYHQVVKVFRSTNMHLFKMYYSLGYGLPCVIVSITTAIGYSMDGDNIYVGEMYCWLKGYYIWSFMAPVLFVVVGNFCILFVAVRIASRKTKDKIAKANISKEQQTKANKKLLQGTISLSLILGMTWAVGFFTMVDFQGATVLSYLFTVLNASQGIFIFVFHCVLNTTIRSNLTKIINTRISSFSRSTNSTQ